MNTKVTNTNFGERLRNIREKKGYTQVELANLSGVSRRMIGHYETLVKRPSIEKIQKLAETLDVSIDELMGTFEMSKSKKKKEDVSYKIMKKVRIIEQLPTRDQNAIFHYINFLSEKNKLKGKIKEG